MYVCVYVCMYVCMYICMQYIHTYVHTYIHTYVHTMYVHMYVRTYTCELDSFPLIFGQYCPNIKWEGFSSHGCVYLISSPGCTEDLYPAQCKFVAGSEMCAEELYKDICCCSCRMGLSYIQ